jgi:hypothetical protein
MDNKKWIKRILLISLSGMIIFTLGLAGCSPSQISDLFTVPMARSTVELVYYTATPQPTPTAMPDDFLQFIAQLGPDYVYTANELSWTGWRSYEHPQGDGQPRLILKPENESTFILTGLDGASVEVTGLIPAEVDGAPVLLDSSGRIVEMLALLDTYLEHKAGWIILERVVSNQETLIGSGNADSPRFIVDPDRMPEDIRELFAAVETIIVTPWGENAFAVYDGLLDRIVYMTGAGEVIGMVNAGDIKINQLPEGVVYMFGYDKMFVFTSEPQQTVFFRRNRQPDSGPDGVWEYEDDGGAKFWVSVLQALEFNTWAALNQQPSPYSEATRKDPAWWVDGDGAIYFRADQKGERTFNFKGVKIDLTDIWFFLPGSTTDVNSYFDTIKKTGNTIVARMAHSGEREVINNTVNSALSGFEVDMVDFSLPEYWVYRDFAMYMFGNEAGLVFSGQEYGDDNIVYWSK